MSSRATAPSSAPHTTAGVEPAILRDIRQASRATDIDFGYLVAQAQQESGFRPTAAARGSSARGLYQFIDSTWMSMVKQFGDRYGAGNYARQIQQDSSGHLSVADPRMRKQILDLRNDPALSASLAAEYARGNKVALESALGRPATSTDLYLAHFLGAGGATAFLKNMQRNSHASGAAVAPEAAAANRSVFYDRRTGHARSVSEIYKVLASKIAPQSQAFAQVMEAGDTAIPADSKMMPLASASRGFMPLRQASGPQPLVAMLNTMAVTAMKAIGSNSPNGKPIPLDVKPGEPIGPAARGIQRANQVV